MADRDTTLTAFLARAGWGAARRCALAGDASARSYLRLHDPKGQTAVLMDAPPGTGNDIGPFVRIATYLQSLGLSAPRILAQDYDAGFLLLEDLGDNLLARLVITDPQSEGTFYGAATDLLAGLHCHPPPDKMLELRRYGPAEMADATDLAFRHYAADPTGAFDHFRDRFRTLLKHLAPADNPVMILRDYHAENLLWLPERHGAARLGLLDFQDAVTGHAAYDLVSLLQDARRDVPPALEADMLARYIASTGQDSDRFTAAYAALGVQRHMRILGIFARLAREQGKTRYIPMIPRVWDHMVRDLAHPALSPVADIVLETLPEPNAATLQGLAPA